MENAGLKSEVLDKIKSDPILYGRVAEALSISPTTLPRLIYANDAKLTQINVLMVLSEHLKTDQSDLLKKIGETNLV